MNVVQLKGGLTKDPELRYTPNGWPICEFSIAVNGAKWDGNERKQVVTTCFITCVQYGPSGETTAESIAKGDEIYLMGELDQSTYEKKDGTKESKTRVSVAWWQPVKIRSEISSPAPAPASTEEDPF